MSKTVSLIFATIFACIGFFMAMLGATVLSSGPANETEWTIGVMGLLAAVFLFIGAWQTFRGTRRKAAAEVHEAERLKKKFAPSKGTTMQPFAKPTAKMDVINPPTEAHTEPGPEIYVRWTYTPKEWHTILQKLAEKTKREELYTAFWFPVLFAIVFWSEAIWGFLAGVVLGFLYIKFRVYFVKTKFALPPNMPEAEIIISDSYLRVNGNFIHYADGTYYLKNLTRENDPKLGELLLFNIGWTTSKGYPAEMDLYLPIPSDQHTEAEMVLTAYKQARA